MWKGDGQPRRPVGPDRPGPCGSADRTAVDGGRRPGCRPALASADEDPVGWPRRLAPDRRVVGCVWRCRNLVSMPGRSAASAVQAAVGHHHRRARPVPATGAPCGGERVLPARGCASCASRIPNSLAESRIEATLRGPGVWPRRPTITGCLCLSIEWLARTAACVPWAGGLKRPVHLRRERRLRQSESPTRGLHQAQGCRPPVRVAASDQLSRSTGRALRSLCRSPTACRHVSASARAPSGPTGWSARSMPSAWSSRTSASSANRAAADLRASSTVGDEAGLRAMTTTPCRRSHWK